jgi:hypothetical protein
MMAKASADKRKTFISAWIGIAIGTAAGTIAALGAYARHEIRRRGYPSWDTCQCDFKSKESIFQVWHSQHGQHGETIVAQEWGLHFSNPPQWLRRFLHHSSQVIATLNPFGGYVERVTLSPQESRQLAVLLRGSSPDEENPDGNAQLVWRREVLHSPRRVFDQRLRRLYPAQIPQERIAAAQPLPAIWDPHTNLPLPTEGSLLTTPTGTRIDWIGWTPSQVSYCTARLEKQEQP